jgi:hypothetical protein
MLGVRALLIPAIILLAIAVVLQTGATTAIKAVKFSAKLVTRQGADAGDGDNAAPASPGAAEPVVSPDTSTIPSEST